MVASMIAWPYPSSRWLVVQDVRPEGGALVRNRPNSAVRPPWHHVDGETPFRTATKLDVRGANAVYVAGMKKCLKFYGGEYRVVIGGHNMPLLAEIGFS